MGVRQRGESWQVDFSWKGKRYRKDLPTKDAAEAWEIDGKARLLKGLSVEETVEPQQATNLEQLLTSTRRRYWAGTKGERTAVKNAEDCIAYLGKTRDPMSLTSRHLDELVEHFKSLELDNGTINRKLAALSRMLTHAQTREWIVKVPKIERLKESAGRDRFYTEDEETKVLTWFTGKNHISMTDFVTTLLDTGVRLTEGLSLKWTDVSDDGESVVVRGEEQASGRRETKGGNVRSVGLTTRVKAILDRRRKEAGDNDRIFHDLTVDAAQYRWNLMRDALGYDKDKDFVIHTCRHTFCSRLAMKGVDLLTIKNLAGHKTLSITERYAHLSPSHKAAGVKALEPKMRLVS